MSDSMLLDDKIAELEAKAAKLRALRDALGDEEVAAMARQLLGIKILPVARSTPSEVEPVSEKSGLERIVEFLKGRGDRPATISEISEGAKITASNCRRILYVANKDMFQRVEKRPDSRESQFRLSASGL